MHCTTFSSSPALYKLDVASLAPFSPPSQSRPPPKKPLGIANGLRAKSQTLITFLGNQWFSCNHFFRTPPAVPLCNLGRTSPLMLPGRTYKALFTREFDALLFKVTKGDTYFFFFFFQKLKRKKKKLKRSEISTDFRILLQPQDSKQ